MDRLHYIVLLIAACHVDTRPLRNKINRNPIVEYNCRLHDDCVRNNIQSPKICGFNEETSDLAIFENRCVLYKTNCDSFGIYTETDMIVCETKQKYHEEHKNETFDFIHIRTTTEEGWDDTIFDDYAGRQGLDTTTIVHDVPWYIANKLKIEAIKSRYG